MKRLVMTAVLAFTTAATTAYAEKFEAMVTELNADSVMVRVVDKPIKVVYDGMGNLAKGNIIVVEFNGEIPKVRAESIKTLDNKPYIRPVPYESSKSWNWKWKD